MSLGRRRFVAAGASAAGLAAVPDVPGAAAVTGGEAAADGADAADADGAARDQAFLDLLTTEADRLVADVLAAYRDELTDISARRTARSLRRLATAWCWRRSAHHRDAALVGPMVEMAEALAAHQHDDGLFDQGNLHSPPDTAFSIADLCLVLGLLNAEAPDDAADAQDAENTENAEDTENARDTENAEDTARLRDVLTRVVRAAGPPIAEGGVHTPNHRWKICAVLARLHALFPDPRYPRRVAQWLAEGVDQYPGGQYSERSPTYAAVVTSPSLLTVARLTDRPELYAHVRRNLEATLPLIEPNGEVVAVHSRRQDQSERRSLAGYWLLYRELALRDGDARFAAVAEDIQRRIAELPPWEDPPGDALAHVLDHPELARPLPPSEPPPTRYVHHDPDTRLVRVRRGDRTATLFGGTDFPEVGAVASGLSTNPTFLSYRRGAAILDSVRLSPQFFSLGHFRSEGLEEVAPGRWRLHARVRAAYHLPLPPQHRRPDGDYPLTDDGRFWSAMDFPHRPRTYLSLRTEILVEEAGGGLDATFEVDESEVPLAIELAFRPGGTLDGPGLVEVAGEADTHHLVSGEASYRVGDDRISFGPGNGQGPGQPPVVDPGERYTWLNGALDPPGPRVLITGRSPFRYRLRLRPR